MYRIFLGTVFVVLLTGFIAFGEDVNDIKQYLIMGISANSDLIKNISCDYTIDYRLSERWNDKKQESIRKNLERQGVYDQSLRFPYTENTVRTGHFVRSAGAFKITNKITASADGQFFKDEAAISDGVKVTEIDNDVKTANIFYKDNFKMKDTSFFPDTFQNMLFDGKSPQEHFESPSVTTIYLGKQKYDGIECEMLETTESFTTPEGKADFTKDRIWIATGNGFLIKHGISFDVDPNKPINSITTEFTEVSPGIWYYNKILFESFPQGNIEPDVSMNLMISNIKINKDLQKETFIPDLNNITSISDNTKNK